MGIERKKQEVYVAFAQDGALIDHEPQRLQVPAVHEETARLRGFLVDFGHVLAETKPDAVRIAQPEQVYEAQYTELAPKAALETLVRLACDDAGVPVEVLHRSTARSRVFGRQGKMDQLIDAAIEPVGRDWNAGQKYAAVAALAEAKA